MAQVYYIKVVADVELKGKAKITKHVYTPSTATTVKGVLDHKPTMAYLKKEFNSEFKIKEVELVRMLP